jgi:hypothetical protein
MGAAHSVWSNGFDDCHLLLWKFANIFFTKNHLPIHSLALPAVRLLTFVNRVSVSRVPSTI